MRRRKNVGVEMRHFLFKDAALTAVVTASIFLLVFAFDHSDPSECLDGTCDPWSWFLIDLLFTLEGATALVAIALFCDMVAQCCECCHWQQRDAKRKKRREKRLRGHLHGGGLGAFSQRQHGDQLLDLDEVYDAEDELLHHRDLCSILKDTMHATTPCVNERRESSVIQSRCTRYSRVFLCCLDVLYSVVFVMHTAVRYYSMNSSRYEGAFLAPSSRWPYLVYLACDVCFAVWIVCQLVSPRSYKSYITQLFSSLPFVCGWVGTMCSAIMCFRRLSNTSSGDDFFSPYGSEQLPPPYSLAFMRMAYVEVLVRRAADKYLKRNVDDFTGQMIKIALGSAVFLFMASAALYTAEGLGDPGVMASSIREGEFVNEWHMLSAVYWAIVTMTTVGYGDMYPISMYGKVLAMGVIVLGISFLGDVIGRLGDLRKTQRSGGEYYRPRLSNRRHIVICGPIDKTMIEELLAQLFNETIKHVWDLDIGGLEVVIMVPSEIYDPDVRRWLSRTNGIYDARVSYLSGDIINGDDAVRARLRTAAACFIFPSAYSGTHEDEETVIRAVSTHQQYGSRVMLYIMLHSTKLKGQLIHARIPRDRILCLDQIKLKLAASAAAVAGSANLLLNLLTFTTIEESQKRVYGGAAEYASGTEKDEDDDEEQEEVEVVEKDGDKTNAATTTPFSSANTLRRLGIFRSLSKVRSLRRSHRAQRDPNIELHIKGATQQFLEYQHPVSGVLVGMRFSAVARDLYRQRRHCTANGEAECGGAENDCDDSDSNSDDDSEHETGGRLSHSRAGLFHRRSTVRSDVKEKDDTPVLLCGLHTTDSNGDKRLIMAPSKSYRLQAGDRLFVIADNLEEVTKGMIALRNDYMREERRRKKRRKDSAETKEKKNHHRRSMESIDIDDSILRTQEGRLEHSREPRRVHSLPGHQSRLRSRSLRHLSSESSIDNLSQEMARDPRSEGYYSHRWKEHAMSGGKQQRGDYARKLLLSTWLGESARRDYLEAIMYPTISVPVLIRPNEQIPRAVIEQCKSEVESLQRCLKNMEAEARKAKAMRKQQVVEVARDGGESKSKNTSARIAAADDASHSFVKTIVMREVEKTVNALSFQVRKASHGGSATACQVSAVRKLESEKDMSERHNYENTLRKADLVGSPRRSSHGNKKTNRNLMSLQNLPLSDARQFVRFNLRAPLKSRLRSHVVICNCDLVTNGHLIIEYFAAKGMTKLLFLCATKPSFSTWGNLVTMREDCEVYFVVGEVTDVAALQNCNIAEAAAMILLFPRAQVPRSGLDGPDTGASAVISASPRDDEDILEANTDRNQRQDQATKLVEKHFLFKQDEHACDILTVPADCDLCAYGSEENCNKDRCVTHEECRNCSDHFERHKECRRNFNPRLTLSLITEMSRQHGISGDMAYNRSEAAGKLFSELDFVSVLAVRFHFKHFITLAFCAIETLRQREVHADWWTTRHTYGEMLLELLREHGIIVVGLLRFPYLGASPLVLTNPPSNTALVKGDQFFYYNGSMSEAEEEALERHGKVLKEERKRRELRQQDRHSQRKTPLGERISHVDGARGSTESVKTVAGEGKGKTAGRSTTGDGHGGDSSQEEEEVSSDEVGVAPRPRHVGLMSKVAWKFIQENRAQKAFARKPTSGTTVSPSLMLQMRAMQRDGDDDSGISGRLSPLRTQSRGEKSAKKKRN